MTRIVYTMRDGSAAIQLDGPDESKVVTQVTPLAHEPVEELGRVYVANPDERRSNWEWLGETLEGALVTLAAMDARSAGWALFRALRS